MSLKDPCSSFTAVDVNRSEVFKKNFFFTFGQDNCTKHGVPMKDYYVRVVADDYGSARDLFVDEFSSQIMARGASNWAFQYEEKDFNSSYCPLGEFCVIE